MTDLEQDAKSWTKEKLLQTSGDIEFLTEKVNKWHNFAYLWRRHSERSSAYLTPAIDENL